MQGILARENATYKSLSKTHTVLLVENECVDLPIVELASCAPAMNKANSLVPIIGFASLQCGVSGDVLAATSIGPALKKTFYQKGFHS